MHDCISIKIIVLHIFCLLGDRDMYGICTDNAGFEQRTKGFRTKRPKMFHKTREKRKKEAMLRQQKVSFRNQIRRRLFFFVFETAGNSCRVSPAFFHLRSRNRWEASSNRAILLLAVDKNPINLLCRRCSFSFFFFLLFLLSNEGTAKRTGCTRPVYLNGWGFLLSSWRKGKHDWSFSMTGFEVVFAFDYVFIFSKGRGRPAGV